MKRLVLWTVLACAALASPAWADTRILQLMHVDPMTMMGQSQPARDDTITVWIAKDRMAIRGGGTDMILRLDMSQAYLLDRAEKTYSVLELPIDLTKLLPADDPNAPMFNNMLEMMKSTTTVTPSEESRKVGQWNARRYDVETKNNFVTIQGVLWATKDVTLDMDLYHRLEETMLALNPALRDAMSSYRKIEGIVVLQEQTVTAMGQTTKMHTETLDVQEAKAPAEVYRVPKEYTKKNFNPMEAMGRG